MMNIDPNNYKSENFFHEAKQLLAIIEKLKKQGKKIGLCTGSFDLLHPGHVTHLISAKKKCDVLVVTVAKDSYSAKKQLGSGRPVFSEDLRAFLVSKLKPVDFVILEDYSPDTIALLKPDIYIKGKDFINKKDNGIIHAEKILASYGGKIKYTDNEKLSTTDIIKHIKREIK